MTHVVHIIDEETGEDAVRALAFLLRCSQADVRTHEVIVLGQPPAVLDLPAGISVRHQPRHSARLGAIASPLRRTLRATAERGPATLVHAWGARVASVAARVLPKGWAILTTLTDPAEAARPIDGWPIAGSGIGELHVVAATDRIRDRLIARGVAAEAVTVIPAVLDVPAEGLGKQEVRQRHGLTDCGPILLTASPPSRAGGHFFAVWAAGLLHEIWPGTRILVPGRSKEQQRIARLVEGDYYCPQAVRFVEEPCRAAELLALADVLVFPAVSDVPTGWLIAAMACGVPVVASDVPCVTELITDGWTGFLCPPGRPHALAGRIRAVLEDRSRLDRCVGEARAWADRFVSRSSVVQAYEARYDALVSACALR